jgi:SAM-dependent methyltransferase
VDSPEVSRALSFGRGAADYDRARPEYSAEALDLVTARLGLGPEAEVLDLGAGTGKLTRALVERFARVTAVEPDPGMRAVLVQVTDCYSEGQAEAIPLADDSVDAVFVGQAFHWFATEEAVREIARVLRPGGGLVLIWNTWWDPDPPLPDAASEVIKGVVERKQLQPVNLRSEDWRSCFRAAPFEELHKEEVPDRVLEVDGEHLVTLYLSTSPFGVLPADERARVENELRRLVTGTYRLPVGTRLYWTRLS